MDHRMDHRMDVRGEVCRVQQLGEDDKVLSKALIPRSSVPHR